MIRAPGAQAVLTDPGADKHHGRKWALACFLILAVTWLPVLGVHLYRTSLEDLETGPAVAVFPPTFTSREVFRGIETAGGTVVRPVTWFPRMWVAISRQPGFAGRLREQGAWAVYSPDLLSARALLTCLRFSDLPRSGAEGVLAPPS